MEHLEERSIMSNAASDFMRSKIAYRKVCQHAFDRYHSYGKITGTMSIKSLSTNEVQDIASFLAWPLYKLEKMGKFKLEDWVASYENSRFGDTPFESVVEQVVGKSLLHHKEQRHQLDKLEHDFVNQIRDFYHGFCFLEDEQILAILYRRVLEGTLNYKELEVLSNTFKNLPKEPIYLPSFAQKMADNPHAFDYGSPLGILLYQLLEVYSNEPFEQGKSAAERRHNLFLKENIILDNIQNYVSVHGFVADEHPMWLGAASTQVSMNVSIKHIVSLNKIEPYNNQVVYIFENSSLFSAIIDEAPHISAVCTHGQFRNASWELFKRIPNEVVLMYSGDFDPEGLLMCQTFCQRFGNAKPWCMDIDHYKRSNPHKRISERSLKKLDSIIDVNLIPIANAIKEFQKAGYQEALFSSYINSILTDNN
jgi:uncharacterized protein (TIGR02679 family)